MDGIADLGEREVLHLRAAHSWASGQWDDATHYLERALLHDSRDLLALKVAQDLYFFLGQSKDILGVVAGVLGAWPPERSGWGYLQGMYAFGLEETGDYQQAEVRARAALQKEPRDTWASHALAHVFEMQGRQPEGIAFLDASSRHWSSSFFAVHNWWHYALYHLELGRIDEALSIYDGPIRSARSTEWLDLVDAAALLWRLSLFAHDLEDRVQPLAADIESVLNDPIYIFNDWHAVMVFGLAGAHDLNERVLTGNRSTHFGYQPIGCRAGGSHAARRIQFVLGTALRARVRSPDRSAPFRQCGRWQPCSTRHCRPDHHRGSGPHG